MSEFLTTPVPSDAMRRRPLIEEVDAHPDATFIWSVIHAVRQDAYAAGPYGMGDLMPIMEIPTSA